MVGDLGGIHDAASISIDFSTGKIKINGQEQNTTLGELMGLDSDTLIDGTYHTLDFFYLERGNTDSNMYLKYNLVTIPESDLIKIDQLGDLVAGAEFTLYAADDTGRSNPIATGTTDSSWSSILGAAKDNPYIFQLASSGAYQVEIDNLPGDVRTCYHLCKDEDRAQYTIAYYYTTADTLEDAAAENTRRIDAESTACPLDRVFSMDLYVPNVKNYLLVQKVDEEGNPITTPATFALYDSTAVTVGEDGLVTTSGEAQAYDTQTTDTLKKPDMQGAAIFGNETSLAEGTYYLVEKQAPEGYITGDQPKRRNQCLRGKGLGGQQ